MVQQTKDSTFTEYRLSHAESGVLTTDKQLLVSVAANKLTLQDVRIENPMTVSKSIESPPFVGGSRGHPGEVDETVGTKRSIFESLPNLKNNAGGGHIVYVRRKTETESAKTGSCYFRSNTVDYPHSVKPGNEVETAKEHAENNALWNDTVDSLHFVKTNNDGETTQHRAEMNKPVRCIPDAAPVHRVASPSFSSTICSVSPSLVMSKNISCSGNINNVHVECTYSLPDDPVTVNFKIWEERYSHLQGLLRMLDQADQDDYIKMLRSLSSVELSRHAVELENRSMKLQLEEAQELQRVRFFDLLGKYPNKVDEQSDQQEKLHK